MKATGTAPAPASARIAVDPLEAVARFVAGFSHRMQSPLTGLRGYGELAEREQDRARRAYWHQQLQGGIDSLDVMLEGFRRYQIPESLKRRTTRLAGMVEEAWRLACQVTPGGARKRLALRVELPADLAIDVDPYHFKNLLVNLLQNAVDASPDRGEVVVTASADETLRIEDAGEGLGGLNAAAMIEPFFTTHPDRAGLGLAVANQIAIQHGFRLDWRDLEAGGACARVLDGNNTHSKGDRGDR